MKDEQLNPWCFNPINLNAEEINDPFLMIANFFSADDVPGHLRELLKWRSCVLEDRYYIDHKGSPAGILFTHQLHIKLIEAMHLLIHPDRSKSMMITAIYSIERLEDEKKTWSFFPENLTEAELLNPFFVLKDFFKAYSLPQYRTFLYEWLEYSLSSKAANEFIETADLINVYENLQKLYAAAWLIHQRTSESPYLKVKQALANKQDIIRNDKANLYQLNSVIPAEQQELIAKLVSRIKHKLETVQAIIYLGVSPNGADTLFLLVLTANDEQRQAQALNAMIEESCQPIATIVASVHYRSFLTNPGKEDNLFVRKALNCPVIYLSGDVLLPIYKSIISFDSQHADTKWARWHSQGADFLNGAAYYSKSGALNAALFSLHQSAECLLVAVIRSVLGYSVNVHNLNRLVKITQMFTADIADLFELHNEASAELFSLLQHAYINVRYKDSFEADRLSVESLLEKISALEKLAENIYKAHLIANCL